jgi:hypothetical protein
LRQTVCQAPLKKRLPRKLDHDSRSVWQSVTSRRAVKQNLTIRQLPCQAASL